MTPAEIGFVFNQLVEKRVLYSFATTGRRRSQEEKEAIEIIEAQVGRTSDLEQFLETQGLSLKIIDALSYGIKVEPGGGTLIYVALRNPMYQPPEHLSSRYVLQELVDDRRNESADAASMWSSFFMLLLFYFIYTQEDRSIESISKFSEAAVSVDLFLEEVMRRIEEMRGLPESQDPQAIRFRGVLTSGSAKEIDSRVRGFFKAMASLGVIESFKTNDESFYRQTLWSAVDVAHNFHRHAGAIATAGLDDVMKVTLPELEAAERLKE